MLRWRHGRLQYRVGRAWTPSRTLRYCCRVGLHFTAWDLRRDGYYCECGRQYLLAEQITSNWR